MKITKANATAKCFENFDIGDVFEWKNDYYMVIGLDCDDCYENAINLSNGMSAHFIDNDLVFSVDCELVIR